MQLKSVNSMKQLIVYITGKFYNYKYSYITMVTRINNLKVKSLIASLPLVTS